MATDKRHKLWLIVVTAIVWSAVCVLFAPAADLGTGPCPSPLVRPTVKDSLTVAAKPAGWHAHQCPRCGTRWEHGHENKGNAAQHTCPKCGTLVWEKAARAIIGWRTICNGGQCVRVPIYADSP